MEVPAQPHHQAAVQHLAYLQQAQRQSPTHGDHSHWVATAEARLEAYLSQHQRLQMLSQGSGANPPL